MTVVPRLQNKWLLQAPTERKNMKPLKIETRDLKFAPGLRQVFGKSHADKVPKNLSETETWSETSQIHANYA